MVVTRQQARQWCTAVARQRARQCGQQKPGSEPCSSGRQRQPNSESNSVAQLWPCSEPNSGPQPQLSSSQFCTLRLAILEQGPLCACPLVHHVALQPTTLARPRLHVAPHLAHCAPPDCSSSRPWPAMARPWVRVGQTHSPSGTCHRLAPSSATPLHPHCL